MLPQNTSQSVGIFKKKDGYENVAVILVYNQSVRKAFCLRPRQAAFTSVTQCYNCIPHGEQASCVLIVKSQQTPESHFDRWIEARSKVIRAKQSSAPSFRMQMCGGGENKGFYGSVIWETYRPGAISPPTPITPTLHNFTYS